MASVLFVSKPIAAPWNDSGKNLVRDLGRGMSRHRATLMVRRGDSPDIGESQPWAVYSAAGAQKFAPALVDQARVFAALLRAPRHALWHFFFAPNPRSCAAGRVATRVRGVRSVHTISSAPRDPTGIVPQLFADVNVVLSRHTERRLRDAGLPDARMVRIAPAIEPLTPPTEDERASLRATFGFTPERRYVVYPGDLEFGGGGALLVDAITGMRDATLVIACRAKTAAARAAELSLRERVIARGVHERVIFMGETPRIHALLACADAVALPSADLYAKMDYPLVLLEAMSLARPVIVARGSAAEELCEGGAARAVDTDADAISAEISGLFSHPEAALALATAGRSAVLTRFTHRAMAEAYEALYDHLLA